MKSLLSDFLNFDIFPSLSDTPKIELIYQGNAKNTLIVVDNNDSAQIEFLAKILKAIHYDISQDVILFPLNKESRINLTLFKKNAQTDFQAVLLFGVAPSQLDLQFKLPNYYPIKINEMTFLAADSLEIISKNQSNKKQLWQVLQQMFLG